MHGNINDRVAANFERAIKSFFSDKIFSELCQFPTFARELSHSPAFPGFSDDERSSRRNVDAVQGDGNTADLRGRPGRLLPSDCGR